MKIHHQEHKEDSYSSYCFIINECTRAYYTISYIKKTTTLVIYHNAMLPHLMAPYDDSLYYEGEDEVVFTFNAIIPMDGDDPMKSIVRLNKLLLLI